MQIKEATNYTLISSDEDSFKEFQKSVFKKINDFDKNHLIIQISEELSIDKKDFLLFLKIAEQKKENGTSFVVLNSSVNADDFAENLNIVPTLQEAEDILEMETIERELGF
ncbi:MAG: hypothetical protein QMB95_05475 [Polaribacter sp.]|jgi:hypothetical protein|uniref:hypothetical protein n=1 Tax=uncultured Polaribacter sp. TaxID=174711 RepID=UPI0030DC6AE2|tara:strand:+ start:4263 stop:4595 length:333 start_codon:yes stop_codon:yes gene_type:complete